MNFSITAFFGGNNNNLKEVASENVAITNEMATKQVAAVKSGAHGVEEAAGAMGKVNGALNEAKESFHAIGIRLHGIGIGILIAEMIKMTMEASKEAQKTRDEYEKIGKTIDIQTDAMARLGDAFSGAKDVAITAVTSVVRGWAMIGVTIADAINSVRGYSADTIAAYEKSARAAEEMEKRAKKAREENNDPVKIKEAYKALAEYQEKTAQERMSEEQKMQVLLDEHWVIENKIKNSQADTVQHVKFLKELEENKSELYKINLKLVADHTAEFIKQADYQKKIAEEMALTYNDKYTAIWNEQNKLMVEQSRYAENTASWKEIGKKLDENDVELAKLKLEYKKKEALGEADSLEMAKLILKSKLGLTSEEANHLKILQLQSKEKGLQVELNELLIKSLSQKLSPAEQERVKALEYQCTQLDTQIKQIEALPSGIEKQATKEEVVTKELEKQTAEIDKQNNKRANPPKPAKPDPYSEGSSDWGGSGSPLGMKGLDALATDVLLAKVAQIDRQLADYNIQYPGRDAKNDNWFLASQMDSIKKEIEFRSQFTASLAGGRDSALRQFTSQGRDPFAFDQALQNMGSWGGSSSASTQLTQQTNDKLTQITGILTKALT